MNPVSTQLELSAASIRLAGYMIESQLRVAQVLGKAALTSNLFAVTAELRKRAATTSRTKTSSTPKIKNAAKATKSANPVAPKAKSSPKPVETSSATSAPVKRAAVKTIKTAKPTSSKATAKQSAPSPQKNVKTAPKPTDVKTVPAKPTAKTPGFRSRAAKTALPENAKTAQKGNTPAPKATAPDIKTPVSSEADSKRTVSKSPRAPSVPPAMPERSKVTKKG